MALYAEVMRPLPALLIAVLVLTATVIPVAGITTPEQTGAIESSIPSITTVDNTTNQLTIPVEDVSQTGYNTTGIDVGTAVESRSVQLHHRHDGLSFEQRFQSLDTREQRTTLIRDQVSAVDDRRATLSDRQSAAIRQYESGEISAVEFLRVRLLINAEATELLETLERIESAPDTTSDYSISSGIATEMRTVEGELRTLNGPVGQRLETEITNPNEPGSIYLEVSESGYMLTTVTEDRYIRETRLNDQRDTTASDQFVQAGDGSSDRFGAVDDRASELYTWLYQRQRPSFTYYGTSGIYELTATHQNGQLTSYIDGGTTDVFYEEQSRFLSSAQTTATETTVNETRRVTVRRSTATGPMLISATNNETEQNIDGRVTINGQRVGSTGSDGALWTIEPTGAYTVNVTTDDGRASVTVPDT